MDRDAVERVARDFIDQHGPNAVPVLRERAELAEAITGDSPSAEAWRDIADAAQRILG